MANGCSRLAPASHSKPPNGAIDSDTRRSPLQPSAIVLHGPTSAGKTTLAKALQSTSPVPAFHISLDAFVTMSNRRDMRNDEERADAYKLHCENLRSTLARIAQTDFDIILDLV
jgi:chloramphenicol 3-O phosphotransferase